MAGLNVKEYCGIFPASAFSGMQDMIYGISHYIKHKFPSDFFKTEHIQTKIGYYSQYQGNKDKTNRMKANRQDPGVNLQKPRLVLLFEHTSNDTKESGLGEVNPFIYPGTMGIDPFFNEYDLFFDEPNGIKLYTANKRVRTNIEIIIETQDASTQDKTLGYLENNLKMLWGERIPWLQADYILPSEMMRIMRKLLFADDLLIASKEKDQDRQEALLTAINDAFAAHLKKYSNGGILLRENPQNPKKKFFVYDRIYQKTYFQVNQIPNMSDGDKKGEVYMKFSVTTSGFFEMYKPLSYLMRTPDVVAGKAFSNLFATRPDPDGQYSVYGVGFMPLARTWPDTIPGYVMSYVNHEKMNIVYQEHQVIMNGGPDDVDLYEWMTDPRLNGKYDNWARFVRNDELFRTAFKLIMYEDDVIYDDRDLMVSGGVAHLTRTDATKFYSIFLLCDENVLGHARDKETRNGN